MTTNQKQKKEGEQIYKQKKPKKMQPSNSTLKISLKQQFSFKLNLDQIIHKLTQKSKPTLFIQQIKSLVDITRQIFINEKSLITLEAPVTVLGDIHGQFKDLLRIFKVTGEPNHNNKFLFLGDYVDRGNQSTQCICLLLAYKIKYPNSFFLLRGNHECAPLNLAYGFYSQCKSRFNLKLWNSFVNCFNCMPPAALISQSIFCMHGGLSPSMTCLDDVLTIDRPCNIDSPGLICDLLWSDPHSAVQLFGVSLRGAGYMYGKQVVDLFCEANNIQLIVRAHQIVQDGYQFNFNKKVITIFSAPNYCQKFTNDAGILKINQNLQCSIIRLSANYKNIQQNLNIIQHLQQDQFIHIQSHCHDIVIDQVIQQDQQVKDIYSRKRKRIQKRKQFLSNIKGLSKKNRLRTRSLQLYHWLSKQSQQLSTNQQQLQQYPSSQLDTNLNLYKLQRRNSQCIINNLSNQQILQIDDDAQSFYIDLQNSQFNMID